MRTDVKSDQTDDPDTAALEEGTATLEPRASTAALISVAGRQLWVAVRFLVAMTIVLGIAYPLVVFGVGQVVAKGQADGSLITTATGKTAGSSLIGQEFTGNQWFIGRPSASTYDAMASGGTNLAADSPVLLKSVTALTAQIAKSDGVDASQVPPDAVTSSGSGLDPDISPQYALIQVNRVAAARHLPVTTLTALVQSHIQGLALGFIGQERVNVLELNLALAAAQ